MLKSSFSAHLISFVILSFLFLSGCSYFRETVAVDAIGAFQITDRDSVEDVDLVSLLVEYAPPPVQQDCKSYEKKLDKLNICSTTTQDGSTTTTCACESLPGGCATAASRSVNMALAFFNCQVQHESSIETRKLARNSVQERLLAASQQRCNAFKTNLQRGYSRTNFGLGVLSTATATLGALTNSALAAAHWSGSAAIFSGTRAEYNQDYMANLAAHVITEGIDNRRTNVYDKIQSLGQSKEYSLYPVEAAIKDAFYYHGQCSVLAGFQEASDSIKYVQDPGINASIHQLAQFKATVAFMSGKLEDSTAIMAQAKVLSETPPSIVGSKLAASSPDYYEQFKSSVSTIDSVRQSLVEKVGAKPNPEFVKKIEGSALDKDLEIKCLSTIAKQSAEARSLRDQAAHSISLFERDKLNASAATLESKSKTIVSGIALVSEKYQSDVAAVKPPLKDSDIFPPLNRILLAEIAGLCK